MRAALGKALGVLLLLLGVSAATFFGIRALVVPVSGSNARAYTTVWGNSGGETPQEDSKWQYTPEDLKRVEALAAEGWESRSVHDFAKALADWSDEDAFHKSEEAMARLDRTYDEDGKHAQFLRRTLDASLGEASTRHYGGYCTRHKDSFHDNVTKERQADVFGDQYVVFQAEAAYRLCYTITDGDKLTVGERDRILDAYRDAVRQYLDGFSEQQLLEEASMVKKLEGYLETLDKKLSTDLMRLEGSSLAWYSAWGPDARD